MAWLKRLRVNHFRQVAPGTEVWFDRGFNVLLGPNGAGKTTLLKLVAMAASGNFAGLAREAFDLDYDLEFAGASLSVAVRNDPESAPSGKPRERRPGFLKGGEILPTWSWEAEVRMDGIAEPFWVRAKADRAETNVHDPDGGLTEATRCVMPDPFSAHFLNVPLWSMLRDAEVRFQREQPGRKADWSLFWGLVAIGRFDEALGGFEAMMGRYSSPLAGDCLQPVRIAFDHLPEHDDRGREIVHVPRGIGVFVREPPLLSFSKNLTLPHTDVPFLSRAVELLQLRWAKISIELFRPPPDTRSDWYGHELSYTSLAFKLGLEGDAFLTQDELSFGEKRLLSFLFYLAARPQIIIADELENGLDEAWVKVCLRSIGSRQCFLTSRSPVLLEHLPFASVEQVQRRFVVCRRERERRARHQRWARLDESQAEALVRAHAEHPREVAAALAKLGLW